MEKKLLFLKLAKTKQTPPSQGRGTITQGKLAGEKFIQTTWPIAMTQKFLNNLKLKMNILSWLGGSLEDPPETPLNLYASNSTPPNTPAKSIAALMHIQLHHMYHPPKNA